MKIQLLLCLSCLFLLIACKKDDCPEGYECLDDTCICPDDKFEGHGMCRNLEAGEYYGLVDCVIQDTIFLKFLEKDNNFYHIQLDYKDRIITKGLSYIEGAGFDSLFISYDGTFGSGFLEEQEIDGRQHVAHIYGRLTPEQFEGRIDWLDVPSAIWNPEPLVTESCPFQMITN